MTLSDQNASLPPLSGAPPHHHIFGRLRTYFLTGLILVGPIYITINLTWWFINWVDDAMRPFIPISLRTETYLPFRVPGYGLIIALVALTLLGFLTAGFVGRTFVEFGENLLNRMPIVRPIYKTMKQIFETLFSKSGSSFGKVALAEFPTGMWSVVFVASPPSADMAAHLPGSEYVSCFLPCIWSCHSRQRSSAHKPIVLRRQRSSVSSWRFPDAPVNTARPSTRRWS